MNKVFSETLDGYGLQESCDTPSAKKYLEALRPNWEHFDVPNRVVRIQDAFSIARSQGMEKDEFCELVRDVFGISLTVAILYVDSYSPHTKPKPKKKTPRPPCPQRTYKSRPVIPKPPKKKEDYEISALRGDWDSLNHYEHMAAVRNLIHRLKTNFPIPVAISMLAQRLNRSEGLITTYYHLASVRKEILQLLEAELIDSHAAIQIESILSGSKNIDTKKLFADLLSQNQLITIKVFREVLHGCFKKKTKNWKNRVTPCRIKPDWAGEGAVLNEYELTYIPFGLLTDEEKKRFHFTAHKKEAYVTFQLMGENRYSRVPMEALEPIPYKLNMPDQPTP